MPIDLLRYNGKKSLKRLYRLGFNDSDKKLLKCSLGKGFKVFWAYYRTTLIICLAGLAHRNLIIATGREEAVATVDATRIDLEVLRRGGNNANLWLPSKGILVPSPLTLDQP